MERAEIFIGASPLQTMAASGGALITKRASRGALLIQKPGILAERHRGKPARRLRDLPIGACSLWASPRQPFSTLHGIPPDLSPVPGEPLSLLPPRTLLPATKSSAANPANLLHWSKLVAGAIEIDHDVITVGVQRRDTS